MGCLGDSSGGNCPERMSCVVFAQNAKASIPISVICRLHNYKLKKKRIIGEEGGGMMWIMLEKHAVVSFCQQVFLIYLPT